MKRADSDSPGTHVPEKEKITAPDDRGLHRGGPEGETGTPGGGLWGTVPGSSRQEGPETGTTRSQGRTGRHRQREERQRVSWDWLIQYALYVEYKGENIMNDRDSYPAPEGGFEIGLTETMIRMAESNQGIFNTWILIEPDKNGVGCFITRFRNGPGRNAR